MSKKKQTSSLPSTITDKVTGEVFELPKFLQMNDEEIIAQIDVRADLSKGGGNFYVFPMKESLSKELTLSVINYRIVKGIRPSEEYDKPSDFAQFVAVIWDAEGIDAPVFALITYGGVSVKDSGGLFDWFKIQKVHPLSKRIKMTIEKVSGKFTFHVVNLSTSPASEEDLDKLKKMIEAKPDILSESAFRNLPNIDAQ